LDKPGYSRNADFIIRKYLFGFCRLRRKIYSRNSNEQAERVALVTPLASGEDLRRIPAFFNSSAALGLKLPTLNPLGMMDAVT
jgi:hypothetical protein